MLELRIAPLRIPKHSTFTDVPFHTSPSSRNFLFILFLAVTDYTTAFPMKARNMQQCQGEVLCSAEDDQIAAFERRSAMRQGL